ncbi:serine carboxypeptidase s28 domain-containing protein [Ditylenchus destructor]|nr:serine carboxypeptidase s28 domain-containing protein [Ditylenchus destructor]
MNSWVVLSVLFVAGVAWSSAAAENKNVKLPLSISPLFGTLKSADTKPAASDYEKWFDQQQNPLDASNKKTFKQRYFVNQQWKNSNNGNVHVLYVEGENTATADMVSDSTLPHLSLAKDLGATAWSLEHRFRGLSQPYKRTFAANYADALSTGHAIEDLAAFIKGQNKDSGESNPKWILVGKNYGAVLALWFRQKYPSLSVGVIADSASIVPSPDFYLYEKFVEEAYSNYSYECWHGIKFAALSVRNEIQYQAGVDRLNYEFKLTPNIDDNKVDYKSFQHLHHNIIQLFEVPIVYNKVNTGPFAKCCGIDDVCKIMQNETVSDIDRVYNLAKLLYTNTHGGYDNFPGLDNDYNGLVSLVNNSHYDEKNPDQATARSWLWQQCHEFGQWITTDFGRTLFSSTVPNDYFIGLCDDAFSTTLYGYNVDTLKNGIKNTTNWYWTSRMYNGTNAVIFNGGADPWTMLSVNSTSDSSSAVVNIKDTGHGAVLQPPHDNDSNLLKWARKSVMSAKAKKWVSGKNNQEEKVEIPEQKPNLLWEPVPESSQKVEFPQLKNWVSTVEFRDEVEKDHPYVQQRRLERWENKKFGNFFKQTGFREQNRKFMNKRFGHQKPAWNSTIKKHYLQTGYVVQDVDHFDPTVNIPFTQRFFKNDLFQRDRDCPRFLMMGGEAAINYMYVDDEMFQFYRWGKDFKAVLYALEHRFYGYSAPFDNSSVEVLRRFLTTEQVLADTAVFIQTMNKVENNTNPRWFIFGGSYPGSLVAAFRVRYPELSVGGIASSAPLQAKTDFYEYMQKVESDIRRFGPTNCPSSIRNISNRWDENYIDEQDAMFFLAQEVMSLDGVIQYDDEKHRYLNYMCSYYKRFDDALDVQDQKRWRKNFQQFEMKQYKETGLLQHGLLKPDDRDDYYEGDSQFFLAQKIMQLDGTIQYDDEKHRYLNYMCNYYKYFDDALDVQDQKRFRIPTQELQQLEMKQYKETGLLPVGLVKPDDRDDYYEGDSHYEDDDDDSGVNRYSDSESGEPEVLCPDNCWGCYRISYNSFLQSLQNAYRNCWGGSYCSDETRLWFWMTCTQWGYAESTNYGYNVFESALPINYILNLCADVFGEEYNRTRVDAGVKATNLAYGGSDNYNGTNVVFVNGSEDPWSTLSVYKPLQPRNTTSILIDGTSHCVDMYREYDHDLQVLKDARKKIKKQLVKWVRKTNKNSQWQ